MTDSFLIDRIPATSLFRDMLNGTQHIRILYITGEAKMGKSRLIREYQRIALHEKNGSCALVDHHRSKLHTYDDLLHTIVQQIGPKRFPKYKEVHDELSKRSNVEINAFAVLFSRISANTSGKDEARERRRLTAALLEDLQDMPSLIPVILLFDAFEKCDEQSRNWLFEHLMTGTCQIPHVWVVVAGQQVPPPLLTWEHACTTYPLLPVSLDDHRTYCSEIGAELSDEKIEMCHHMFEGKPGLFVEFVGTHFGRRINPDG